VPRKSICALICALNLLTWSWIQAAEPEQRTIASQSSYIVSTPQVELAVTALGGQMSPVTFYRDTSETIQPYYISPWQDEKTGPLPVPVLVPLRGDFFCLPFGGNMEEFRGEKHPPHGETAGSPWKLAGLKTAGDVTTLTLSLETKVRPGRVTKELSLVNGENVVYSAHAIEGFAGPAPLGHHATLAMPSEEGVVRLASSPIRFGMTYPGVFSDPKQQEYQSLLPGTKWNKLSEVPLLWKGSADADLSRLPARRGFADLVQLVNQSWEETKGPAWMTATFGIEGFVWFSLKDPAVLASTVFWIENHGRHGEPWNGRNNCLGLEDVTTHFADGLVASAGENVLKNAGVKTIVELQTEKPTVVRYIQGVAKIPAGFDVVASAEFSPGKVTLVSAAGPRVTVPVRHEYLRTGRLNGP
jgi:hypothetical protein